METVNVGVAEFFDMPLEDILDVSHAYVAGQRLNIHELQLLRLSLDQTKGLVGSQVAEDLAATIIVAAIHNILEQDFQMPAGSLLPAFGKHRLSRHPREAVERERNALIERIKEAK